MTSEDVRQFTALVAPLLAVLESTFGGPAVYLSTPITSGRAFLGLSSRRTGASTCNEAIRQIKEGHIGRAAVIAGDLRKVHRYVINPAAMPDVEGWTQAHYIALWLEVIERFVTQAFFVDEWNYSRGCSQEFLACLRKGIPALDERGEAITVELGAALIAEAVVGYDDAGLDASIHRQVLAELENL